MFVLVLQGSFLPTVCEYSTQCAACGFRENTQTIEQDNSCATANNGVCEDGDFGSMFVLDAVYGGVTSACALGTDRNDCAGFGERLTQAIGADSFQGLTNFSRPSPPPPQPMTPPPSPPPPFDFDGCRTDVCYAYFKIETDGTYTFDCSGTFLEIQDKRTRGLCAETEVEDAVDVCSDGGYDARAVLWTGTDEFATLEAQVRFGCDYGSQCVTCGGPRLRDDIIDIGCATEADRVSGKCRDSCFVASDQTIVNEEEKFYTGTLTPDTLCHDGGPGSIDGKCAYGTQVSEHSNHPQPLKA